MKEERIEKDDDRPGTCSPERKEGARKVGKFGEEVWRTHEEVSQRKKELVTFHRRHEDSARGGPAPIW